MSTCRSCGREILWAVTTKGKKIPLDEPPERRFTVGHGFGDSPPVAELVSVRSTHFETCPNADQWRNSTKAKG